jgi:RHS repeat-associated protein
MDRVATRTDALGRQETYHYDAASNIVQYTDRKNQTSIFTYDNLNRRISASYADGSSTSFIYDSVGRRAAVTDLVSGTIQFGYDNLDRLSQGTTPQGTIVYSYDALGRRITMTVGGQQPVSYQYDAASRLTQVAQGGLAVGLGYDKAGRRTSLIYPNGTSASYTYDNASRLQNILHQGPAGVIESLTYTYDTAGNRINLTRANSAATNLPAAVQAAYDAANEQTQFAGANLTYDQNGNLTSDGTNTYTWDARNRVTALSGAVSASFSYDALGGRISKTVNGVTAQYLYDGNDIVLESGASGVASYLRSLNIDEPFVRQSSSNEFYHTDALGSVLALTGQTGATQTSYNYEPFGKTTITGASSNPFQYTGRENDGTGLYYYRARYYSPLLYRFIREDPINFHNPDSNTNFYLYSLNNPVNFKDPFGLWRITGQEPGIAIPPLTPMPTLWPFLDCMDNCARKNAKPGQDPMWIQWTVTSTHEPGIRRADPGHAAGTSVDLRVMGDKDVAFCCAKKCGAARGLNEQQDPTSSTQGPNWHFELRPPSRPNLRNDLPACQNNC